MTFFWLLFALFCDTLERFSFLDVRQCFWPWNLDEILIVILFIVIQWQGISCKHNARWQHLSRLKASAFFSLQNFFSCYKKHQLILGTGTAIWWVTEPHCLVRQFQLKFSYLFQSPLPAIAGNYLMYYRLCKCHFKTLM